MNINSWPIGFRLAGYICAISAFLTLPLSADDAPVGKHGGTHTSEQRLSDTVTAKYVDTFTDYYRGEKLVLRKRQRKTYFINEGKPFNEHDPAIFYDLNVPLNGKVVVSIGLGKAQDSFSVLAPCGINVDRGHGKPSDPNSTEQFFHICIPDHDYYEYFHVDGINVVFKPVPPSLREAMIERTKKGFLEELPEGTNK